MIAQSQLYRCFCRSHAQFLLLGQLLINMPANDNKIVSAVKAIRFLLIKMATGLFINIGFLKISWMRPIFENVVLIFSCLAISILCCCGIFMGSWFSWAIYLYKSTMIAVIKLWKLRPSMLSQLGRLRTFNWTSRYRMASMILVKSWELRPADQSSILPLHHHEYSLTHIEFANWASEYLIMPI